MTSEEEVLKIIRQHPEVIVEALASKPEPVLGIVAKYIPWTV